MTGKNSDKENTNNEISGLANSRETNAQDNNEVGQIASEEGNRVPIELGDATSNSDDEGKPNVQVRGRPFKKGQSGNPKGKPKGALGFKGRLVKALLNESAEAIAKNAASLALGGELSMIKLCLTPFLTRSDDPVALDVAPLKTPADCRDAIGQVLESTFSGEITPNEAKKLVDLIERRRDSFEVLDLERDFNAIFLRNTLSDLLAKYPVGRSSHEDLRSIYDGLKDLYSRNLPESIHEVVFFGYYDFLLEHASLSRTPECFVQDVDEYFEFRQEIDKKIAQLGIDGYREQRRIAKAARQHGNGGDVES